MSRNRTHAPHGEPQRYTPERLFRRDYMRVRLIKKFARMLNGVDLTLTRVGGLMTVSERDGEMLIAEGWAVPHFRASSTAPGRRHAAADRAGPLPPRSTPEAN